MEMEDETRSINQIAYPCAACKIGRRKCGAKCALAPYFPPDNPYKFLIAQRMFGARNILKIIRDVPPQRREDAVDSMVYEAGARVIDPVYGCTGVIFQLHKQILELQSQLASTKEKLEQTQACLASLTVGFDSTERQEHSPLYASQAILAQNKGSFDDDECVSPLELWEPLWT